MAIPLNGGSPYASALLKLSIIFCSVYVCMSVCVQTAFTAGIRKSTETPEEQAPISNEGCMRARMVNL